MTKITALGIACGQPCRQMTLLTALSDVDFKYKRSFVKPHAVQSYKESTSAAAAYSREQRTQADVRFPAASSDSTSQRCLFIGDKLKLFTHHLHPPSVCSLFHLLNYKVFQRREMQWSGLLLGTKSMSEWVNAHPHMHNPQTCKWRRSLPISTAQGKLLEECEPSLFSVKLQETEFGGLKLSQSLWAPL